MLQSIINYLILPEEKTEAEIKHVRSINKIALVVAYLHVPLFVLVALACDTGVMNALILSTLVLAGPTIASRTIEDPRKLSLIFGFTSMCLGAVLVHLCQSSVQIEMHFHFFVFLALLAVYGNPLTILVAAVTVALHHAIFWLFLPESVFNYEAAIWVVGIHALFVVLESVASCFIARNFFDNVIGLEKILVARTSQLNQRNDDMKMILDNTDQGLLTIALDTGIVAAEKAAKVNEIFGQDLKAPIWDWFEPFAPGVGAGIRLGFDALVENVMPESVSLVQLPSRFEKGESFYSLSFLPIRKDGKIKNMLMMISDITAELERNAAEKKQQELMRIFECINRDRAGFVEYLDETNRLVNTIKQSDSQLKETKRYLHTIKGNSGILGVTSMLDVCREMENRIEEDGTITKADINLLESTWASLGQTIHRYLGEDHSDHLQVTTAELEKLIEKARQGMETNRIISELDTWKHEPMAIRLERLATQARGIAERLNQKNIHVETSDNGLRMPQDRWASFWSSFAHILRNAIDHGLKDMPDDGKPTLKLTTDIDKDNFLVVIEDNGHGIDWQKVEAKANGIGLPASCHEDLVDALFTDGLSTRDEVNEISGRGVGMSAVKEECQKLGGTISVTSELHKGTNMTFSFPLNGISEMRHVA